MTALVATTRALPKQAGQFIQNLNIFIMFGTFDSVLFTRILMTKKCQLPQPTTCPQAQVASERGCCIYLQVKDC